MPIRVAVFTDNDFEKVNGVTTALNALLDHAPEDLVPRIYTASVLGIDSPHYLALASAAMPIPFYAEMKMYAPRWQRYLQHVVDDGVEVLHLTTPGPVGLTAAWIGAKTGLPLVGSFHTDLATYTSVLSHSPLLGALMRRYTRWLYGRCVRTLVPSLATRNMLVEAGLHTDRLGLWTRGVDTDLFTPERRSPRLRERWRACDREPVVLYVGRLSREKGLEMLPEMLYRLRAGGVPHRMVIGGDGPLRPWLVEQLPDAVFTGTLDRSEVADVFASGDLFVFPSTTDTAGNVVLEAQASSVPVLVSHLGGPHEQMVDGVTGVVCTSESATAWAKQVMRLLRDAPGRRQMGLAGREFAMSRRWDHAMASVYQAYRDVAAAAPTRVVHRAA